MVSFSGTYTVQIVARIVSRIGFFSVEIICIIIIGQNSIESCPWIDGAGREFLEDQMFDVRRGYGPFFQFLFLPFLCVFHERHQFASMLGNAPYSYVIQHVCHGNKGKLDTKPERELKY